MITVVTTNGQLTITEVAKHVHFKKRMWHSIECVSDKTLSGIVMGSESKDEELAVRNPLVFSY